MRKMQEYIVKGKQIFIGLEDSKKTWKLCVRCEGLDIHETSMPAEYPVLHRYLLRHYPACQIAVMYEAGFAGFGLYDRLTADGIHCVVTPPHTVTQAKVSRVKTDTRDARRLARNLESGDYVACHVPDQERRADRQLSRSREQLHRNIVRVKNRIRRFLDFHGLNGDLPPGRWNDARYRALCSWQVPSPSLQAALEVYLEELAHLQQLHARVTTGVRELSRQPRYQAAVAAKQSCPGIGWLTAIRLTLEWGDLRRFPTAKQFASFTGLTSREYSTGETVRRGSITGASSKAVRRWLVECAWRAVKGDPVLLAKFQAVLSRSGKKNIALVAVARKLALRIRAVELSGTTYCKGVVK